MESQRLNSPQDEDATLAALLRAQIAPIADDGFSARVLAALPPRTASPAPRLLRHWPWLAYFGGGLGGVGVIATQAPNWSSLADPVALLLQAITVVLGALSDPWLLTAVALSGLSVVLTIPLTRSRRFGW